MVPAPKYLAWPITHRRYQGECPRPAVMLSAIVPQTPPLASSVCRRPPWPLRIKKRFAYLDIRPLIINYTLNNQLVELTLFHSTNIDSAEKTNQQLNCYIIKQLYSIRNQITLEIVISIKTATHQLLCIITNIQYLSIESLVL